MYVLVNHEGNADEDSLMVVGVYGSIGAAREAMEKDVDEYIDEYRRQCGY